MCALFTRVWRCNNAWDLSFCFVSCFCPAVTFLFIFFLSFFLFSPFSHNPPPCSYFCEQQTIPCNAVEGADWQERAHSVELHSISHFDAARIAESKGLSVIGWYHRCVLLCEPLFASASDHPTMNRQTESQGYTPGHTHTHSLTHTHTHTLSCLPAPQPPPVSS